MRVASPIPHKKARIEIIPLIDIMFFLLASFMMVSLSQVHMKGRCFWSDADKAGVCQRLSRQERPLLLRQGGNEW